MKKLIWDKSDDISFDQKTIKSVIKYLQELKIDYSENAIINYDYYDYDRAFDINIKYEREETDFEYERRLARELHEQKEKDKKTAKKQQKLLKTREEERKEFERLKAIYGNT